MKKSPVSRFSIFLAISALITVLCLSQAYAFMTFVEPINNTILKDEYAAFKLTIQNTLDTSDYFIISSRDSNWIVSPQTTAQVKPKDEVSIIVQLSPKQYVGEGRYYFVPVKIESGSTGFNRIEEKKFAVYVGEPGFEKRIYVSNVVPNIIIDKVIDPRDKISVKVKLTNWNPKEISDLKVTVDGQEFYKEYTTTILPLEEKTNEILFEVSPLLEPGKRTLILKLSEGDKLIGESTAEYEILGYVDLKESVKKESSLFRSKERITIFNNGNKQGAAEHLFKIALFQRLFTQFSPEAEKEKGDDGKIYYAIRQDLGSQKTLEITRVTNYRGLVTVIIFIILCIVLYFIFRSPIILVKKANPIGKTTDGLSEVKVRIYLKNRSRKPVVNVRIIDVVPSIVEFEKTKHIGSMEPVNISKGTKGTIAKWEFESLEPYEERVIAYNIKSKLKLIGGIRLPHTKSRFESKKGKERVAYSNNVNLVLQEEEINE